MTATREVLPVNVVDLRRESRDAFPALRLVDERIAVLLSGEFAHALRSEVDIDVASASIERWSSLREELGDSGCHCLLQLDALGGHGVLSVETELLFLFLERLFGGGSTTEAIAFTPEQKGRFSPVEERIIRRVVHLFGRTMENAWRNVVPLHVAHLRIETKGSNIPIAEDDEWVLVSHFTIQTQNKSSVLRLILPMAMLEAHRPKLAMGRLEDKSDREVRWRQSLSRNLHQVVVPCTARLGQCELSLREILKLEVGQVLRLDQAPEDAITVLIADVPKFLGQPTVNHGNLAVELDELIPRRSPNPSAAAPSPGLSTPSNTSRLLGVARSTVDTAAAE